MAEFDVSISVREVGKKSNEYSLQADIDGKVTLAQFLEFTRATLLTIAQDTLKEEQQKGFDKNPIVVVDGSPKKPISFVSPLGKIEFVSSQVSGAEVLEQVYLEILSRSKIVTGTYIEGNIVAFNGSVIATTIVELRTWLKTAPELKPGDIIRFVNVVPYARKLERYGVTAQRSKTKTAKSRDKQKRSGDLILAANGVYFLASRAASRNFKNNIKIKFEFLLGSTLGLQQFPAISKNGKPLRRNYKPDGKRPKNSGPYLYPTIKLTVNERGVV